MRHAPLSNTQSFLPPSKKKAIDKIQITTIGRTNNRQRNPTQKSAR